MNKLRANSVTVVDMNRILVKFRVLQADRVRVVGPICGRIRVKQRDIYAQVQDLGKFRGFLKGIMFGLSGESLVWDGWAWILLLPLTLT